MGTASGALSAKLLSPMAAYTAGESLARDSGRTKFSTIPLRPKSIVCMYVYIYIYIIYIYIYNTQICVCVCVEGCVLKCMHAYIDALIRTYI